MYQIYSLLGLMVMTWGIAIWASLSENPNDCGSQALDDHERQTSLRLKGN